MKFIEWTHLHFVAFRAICLDFIFLDVRCVVYCFWTRKFEKKEKKTDEENDRCYLKRS